jgi:hypothetical protein
MNSIKKHRKNVFRQEDEQTGEKSERKPYPAQILELSGEFCVREETRSQKSNRYVMFVSLMAITSFAHQTKSQS